ncbi:hypothetical protein Agau_P200583 (plasmid) [Agrobacterium tumefaciens F2]|nr:hypothetical protein Agau_P200583 [Agrobacterium tumefaciens F2]
MRSSDRRANRAERFELEDDRRRSTDHVKIEPRSLGYLEFSDGLREFCNPAKMYGAT